MKQKMSYKSITPSIGAEVSGFDCSNIDSDTKETLRRLLISRKVLVFRDQIISPLEFLEFMKIFGLPYAEDLEPQDGNPAEVGVIKIKPNERQ